METKPVKSFEIRNWSSPGAHFSENTILVMQKIDRWICEHGNPILPFVEFRENLEKDEKINDNNARNIYPLLKNGGLVEYFPGADVETEHFFTDRGRAYLKALETRDFIEEGSFTNEQIEEAIQHVDDIIADIIYDTVRLLVENQNLNYSQSLRWYLSFLSKFGKINKQEFALLIYYTDRYGNNWEPHIEPIIMQYRYQQIDIDVKVRVKNDQRIQQKTGEKTRLEGIDFLTSYNYYSTLIDQAGLTIKDRNGYHCIIDNCKSKIDDLIK